MLFADAAWRRRVRRGAGWIAIGLALCIVLGAASILLLRLRIRTGLLFGPLVMADFLWHLVLLLVVGRGVWLLSTPEPERPRDGGRAVAGVLLAGLGLVSAQPILLGMTRTLSPWLLSPWFRAAGLLGAFVVAIGLLLATRPWTGLARRTGDDRIVPDTRIAVAIVTVGWIVSLAAQVVGLIRIATAVGARGRDTLSELYLLLATAAPFVLIAGAVWSILALARFRRRLREAEG